MVGVCVQMEKEQLLCAFTQFLPLKHSREDIIKYKGYWSATEQCSEKVVPLYSYLVCVKKEGDYFCLVILNVTRL